MGPCQVTAGPEPAGQSCLPTVFLPGRSATGRTPLLKQSAVTTRILPPAIALATVLLSTSHRTGAFDDDSFGKLKPRPVDNVERPFYGAVLVS